MRRIFRQISCFLTNSCFHLFRKMTFFLPIRILAAAFILLIINLICGYKMYLHPQHFLTFFLLAACEPFIYFVAETKGSMRSMELRGIEKSKIACARKHFAAISSNHVVYDVVNSYDELLKKVM